MFASCFPKMFDTAARLGRDTDALRKALRRVSVFMVVLPASPEPYLNSEDHGT